MNAHSSTARVSKNVFIGYGYGLSTQYISKENLLFYCIKMANNDHWKYYEYIYYANTTAAQLTFGFWGSRYSHSDGAYHTREREHFDYIRQSFSTIPNERYRISFWLKVINNSSNIVNVTTHLLTATSLNHCITERNKDWFFYCYNTPSHNLTYYTLNFTTGNCKYAELIIELSNDQGYSLLDDISVLTKTSLTELNFGFRYDRSSSNLDDVSVLYMHNNQLLQNGTFYGYHVYRHNQWYNEMANSDKTLGAKHRIVVLRTVIEPVRSLIGPRIKYIEAACVDIDPTSKVITCSNEGEKLVISTDPGSNTEGGAFSKQILDSACTRPKFDMKYDTLVIAAGSQNNTFNTLGAEKYAHFLKEIADARRIGAAISDAFKSAMIPSQTAEERKRLLQFVVVGGGPTGVEFAAEARNSELDKKISDYMENHFHRENIEVLTNTRVKAVKQREVIIQKKGLDELSSVPCSVVIWAAGIRARSLTNRLHEIIGPKFQSNRMGLVIDQYLRVKGVEDGSIYALGDCGTIEQPKLLDRLQLLFEEADKKRDDLLDLQEFQTLLELFSKGVEKSFHEADEDKSSQLSLAELRSTLEKADQKLRALPATAQVAAQQGLYVANLLNQIAISHDDTPSRSGTNIWVH
ncbi:unnamed protein product [Didymodactylos carnosus]|uniref:NADH:ubiquinone reductase (non-electrogenic) n=1 Tax=Didymodactylos carnosus TaxID=1234261 RepID=A0A814VRX2_9BILA|nr:unnamed protein product [Didymodactylos carnosus]CAF3956901.1 unnamed protein product [Didymodactylos carnosus]